MKHAKEPGQINSLCGKPVKPYGKAKGRVQAIPAHLCWNVSQAKPMARENSAEWCGKCLAGMGLAKPRRGVKTVAEAFGDLGTAEIHQARDVPTPGDLAEQMSTYETPPEDGP